MQFGRGTLPGIQASRSPACIAAADAAGVTAAAVSGRTLRAACTAHEMCACAGSTHGLSERVDCHTVLWVAELPEQLTPTPLLLHPARYTYTETMATRLQFVLKQRQTGRRIAAPPTDQTVKPSRRGKMLMGAEPTQAGSQHTCAHADAHSLHRKRPVNAVCGLHQHSRFAVLASKLKAGLAAAVFDNILHKSNSWPSPRVSWLPAAPAQRSTAQQHTSRGTQRQRKVESGK